MKIVPLFRMFFQNFNNNNKTAFIHAFWKTSSKRAMQGSKCSQALFTKAAQGDLNACWVWQTTGPGWSPTLFDKACNFNVSRYCSTGTRDHPFTWLSEPRHVNSPTVMSARLGHNEWDREKGRSYNPLADNLAYKATRPSLPLPHRWFVLSMGLTVPIWHTNAQQLASSSHGSILARQIY